MSQITLKKRDEIPTEFKWNQASIFPNDEAWAKATEDFPAFITQLEGFRGRMAESPAVIKQAFDTYEQAYVLLGKILIYANIAHSVDTTDQNATSMVGKAYHLYGQLQSVSAYMDPELVQIGLPSLQKQIEQHPEMQVYAHYYDNLFRKQSHLRSAEVEELLGMLAPAFASTPETSALLTDADMRFAPAHGADHQELPVSQGTLHDILSGPDREARRTAWESYMDAYLEHKNTLANNLNTSIQQNVFESRARRYPSTLEASLFKNAIPTDVFYNLINTYKQFLPVWHHYWRVRRKALKVEKLHTYDVWAPLTAQRPSIPYLQAVDLISAALKPMGEDYVRILRKGCLEDHWVDVYPCKGKTSSTFSSGIWGTLPFIVMSYDETIFSVSSLAHELGHSMHSYYTWQNQPVLYSDYSLFVAEVASNFHQAMLRAYLLETNKDPDFQISVIEEAMNNFHRYFFIMPALARFELEMHQRAERGEGLTADDMIHFMADLYAEGYGSEMELDPQRDGITWATFNHLYTDYYVYAYATGISGANALSQAILQGKPNAAARYLEFISSGSAVYPVDVLKKAGADLSQPQTVERTFQVLEGLVNRLEALTANK